ncbi:MAG: hypothetical protein GF416_04225 [Candidatus Altiarchaeales archaeon]|nr:hypothetical protein [Candidatus Altiarchaeales archaeon]MBD3416327.1 hypothetical protein [Candidatus Altiarchaeales archaeon]
MRLAALFLVLAASVASAQGCDIGLGDESVGVHATVETCSNIGTFSVGGLYMGSWQKLTYHYPKPWRGTYATFNIDGDHYCTSDIAVDCNPADDHINIYPTLDEDSILAEWMLPGVKAEQRISVHENTTVIKYSFTNVDSVNHTVGVRLHMDTLLGQNDGAPIYFPGEGLKTSEVSYGKGTGFEYWKAYNQPDQPTIVVTGVIDPKDGMSYPDRIIVADWKSSKSTAWEYQPASKPVTGDSAVILYYDLGVVEAGETAEAMFGYGSEPPVLTEEQAEAGVGLAEITLGNIMGEYCPGDMASFKVDVISVGSSREVIVGLVVESDGIIYFNNTRKANLPADTVKVMEYTWPIPELNSSRSFDVKAVLYGEEGVSDVKTREDAITVDVVKCGYNPVVEVGKGVAAGTLLVALIVGLGMLIAFLAYLWMNRGSVEVHKTVDGENVTVTVVNNTMRPIGNVVIEDVISGESEIKVKTLNVLRSQNNLRWEVGRLKPKESAKLEYWVKDGRAINDSTVTWDKGSKRLR